MLKEKFIFVNTDGFYSEDIPSTDAYDATGGRIVKTGANGYIDNSLIQSSLFGKVFGVRAASTVNVSLASPGASFDGVTLNNGDRVLLKNQTTASQNGIYVFAGASSPLVRATDFDESAEIKPNDIVIPAEGTLFAEKPFMLITDSPIVVGTTSLTFQLLATNAFNAGRGLSFTGASGADLDVNIVDGGAGGLIINADFVEINWYQPGVDNPATASRAAKVLDLYANGTGQGAKIIGVDNAGSVHGLTTNLQTSLVALDQAIIGPSYTAGTGGVTAGDLVYISSNNTVTKADTAALVGTKGVIGLAFTSASAGNPVRVARNGEIVIGALSGASAGDGYYWRPGTGLSTNYPNGLTFASMRVYRAGYAKNATDLQVQLEFIARNSIAG